jgi:hypothetical protein
VPDVTFSELAELPRAEGSAGNGNGHDSTVQSYAPGFAREVRAPNTPGRSIDPRGRGTFSASTLDVEKRPYGRDRQFIESLEAISDFDPQASQAVWNFLRLMNPGLEVVVYTGPLGKGEARENGKGQRIVDELIPRCFAEYGGGLDQGHNVLSLMLIQHGAIASEMAPVEDLSATEDFYPINPQQLEYKRVPLFPDDKVGKLTLGQRDTAGKWIPVNANQVFYQGLDPQVNKPYGRPPLMAALQTVLSKSVMLNDLRAVAHNQGYPRIDVKVLWEILAKAAPRNLQDGGREKDLTDWMRRQLELVAADYNALNVDDTFVHYDWVDVGMVGPNYAATSFDFKGLEEILSRQINSALKTLPILLGYNEATSETHGSIQWQIQVDGIKALQKLVKRLIEKLFNASLRLEGIDARAKVEYKPIRTVDRKFEAESGFVEAKTYQIHVQMGWADNDEIAQNIYGHDAVAEPVYPGSTGIDPALNQQGNEGTGDKNPDGGGTKAKEGVFERLWAEELSRKPVSRLAMLSDETEDICTTFAIAAGVVFMQAKADLIETLRLEGIMAENPEKRDQAKDVGDYVFGLRFSREMKRLLREAITRGMELAGLEDVEVPEALVERIWRQNFPYVRRIRDDMKAALRAGEFTTIADIDSWFKRNAFRETLMGRFLARQGVTGGYAYAGSRDDSQTRFIWHLNPAEHCADCPDREGQTYTYDELLSVGFPGSINLACGGNCKCSLSEESGPATTSPRSPSPVGVLADLLTSRDLQMAQLVERITAPVELPPVMLEARDDDRLIAALEAVGNRPVEVHTTIEPGAVQVTLTAPEKSEPKLLTREAEFITDERGVIVGKKETETWQ